MSSFSSEASGTDVVQMLLGRDSPSGWKIKYLLHQQECLFTLVGQARLSIATASLLCHPPQSLDDGGYDACQYLSNSMADIEFIATELEKLANDIDQVIKLIKDQMDLSQSFWSTVLAFVVAIYVPISFASVRCCVTS